MVYVQPFPSPRARITYDLPYEVEEDGVLFKGDEVGKEKYYSWVIVWMEYKFRSYTYVVARNPHSVFMFHGILESDRVKDGIICKYWKQLY